VRRRTVGVGMLQTQSRQFTTAGGSFSCSARRGGTVGRGDRGGLGGSRGGSRTLAGRMLARPLASLSSDSSDLPLATEPSSAIGLSPSTADRKIFILEDMTVDQLNDFHMRLCENDVEYVRWC
jgi:hypothetical protein